MYKNLDNYTCDKYYYVETKSHGVFRGYMLNYNWGNIVMISPKGVIHMPYSEANILIPLSTAPSEEFEKMVEDIKRA